MDFTLEELKLIRRALARYGKYTDPNKTLLTASTKVYDEIDARTSCPFTHSHTRDWCGYEGCRES